MKWLSTSVVLLSIGLSGCVSDKAIYADYGNLACGGIDVYEGEFWPSVVNFDFDDRTLDVVEKRKLDNAIMVLKNNPDLKVAIVGSADPEGTLNYNRRLAHDRSAVVAEYFVANNIVAERLVVSGVADRLPFILTNDKAVNRVNRRAHLILLDADFNPVSMRYNPTDNSSNAQ